MRSLKNILLVLASVSFVLVIGAGLYEHVAAVPRWSAAPPASLTMFQGKYGLNPALFWMSIHPVTLLLLMAALISNWKTERKKQLLWALGGYVIILILTATWFVPNLVQIINIPYHDDVNEALRSKAALWEKLSIVRLFIMVVLSFILLSSLIKPVEKTSLDR